MSARINLAPEVYQKHQRDKRNKRIATTVATTTGLIAGGFVIVMLIILGAQKAAISIATNDIKNKQQQIENMSDLKKAATAQAHLNSWNDLTSSKVRISKFFAILEQFVPQGISVSSISLANAGTIELNASAKNYALVNKMVKALEAANVEIGPNASSSNEPLFTDVDVTQAAEDQGSVSFKLTAGVAPEVTSGD